jgi:hypothetical protein
LKSRKLVINGQFVLTFIVTIFVMALYKHGIPQSGTLYKNKKSVMDAGSGKIFSEKYCTRISLGQPVVGSQSNDYVLYNGFFSPKKDLNSVELSSFMAIAVENIVKIEWSTLNEYKHKGFNLYRSISDSGQYRRINKELITSSSPYCFIDRQVKPGVVYFYKLEAVDIHGYKTVYGPISIDVSLPKAYALHQNYPNPFNPETNIKYRLPEANHVILKILNVLGQEIKTLVDEEKEAGYFTVHWDGKNNFGEEVAGGVYFYRLITNDFVNSKKMLLIR